MIPIVLINLDKDVERLQNAMKQLSPYFNVLRFPGINGKELSKNELPISLYCRYLIDNPNNRCSHQQINTMGGVGCYLSHCCVWDLYKELSSLYGSNSPGGIIIFEDDLKLCDDFEKKIYQILKDIPPDCDVLSFGYLGLLEKCQLMDKINKSDALFFGLQGYYISSRGMKTLLEFAFPIEVHIDAYIALAAKQGLINLYFTKKSFVQQCNVISNITDNYCYKCMLPNISMTIIIVFIAIFISVLVLLLLIILIKFRK